MRPIDELTMLAHGLLEPSEEAPLRMHVDACPSCQEQLARLREERELLERAAKRDSVSPAERAAALRPRRSLVPVTIAAALLLGLGGILLYRPGPDRTTADAGRNATTDPVDRLITELKSPNPLRRETAVLALTAYGQAAAARIQKAKVDPAFIPGIRWRAQDPAVESLLRSKKLNLSFEGTPLEPMLEDIGARLGIRIDIDGKARPKLDLTKTIVFKVKDLTGANVLKLLGSQFALNVFCEDGRVVLSGELHPGPARAPVRIGNRAATAGELLRALESPSEDERRRAERDLERLNFAAEGALWAGLDSPIAHARDAVSRLLRRLYEDGDAPRPSSSEGIKATLREKRLSLDLNDAPLTAVADHLREASGLNIHLVGIDNPDFVSIRFKGEDVTLFEALTLALDPGNLGVVIGDDVLQITRPREPSAPRSGGPLWCRAEAAARIESLLEALGSRDPAARRTAEQAFFNLGEDALAPLGEALRVCDLPMSGQARALRDRILEDRKLWLLEGGSGADLQPLSDDQRRRLERTLTLSLESVPRDEFLSAAAKASGFPIELRARPAGNVTLAVKEVRLRSLLRALTLPQGLDYYLDGDRIVVDTAARVRAAVEK